MRKIFLFFKNLQMFVLNRKIRFYYDDVNKVYCAKEGERFQFFSIRQRGFRHYRKGLNYRAESLAKTYGIHLIEFNKEDIVIECGANVGDLYMYLENKIKPDNYIAFEPSQEEFNAILLNAKNSRCFSIGLGNKNETQTFYLNSRKADSSIIEPEKYSEKVSIDVTTLDSFCEKHKVRNIKLFKLEAEGFEPEILQGAKNILQNIEYVAIDGGYERGIEKEETFSIQTNYLNSLGFEMQFVHLRIGRALFRRVN